LREHPAAPPPAQAQAQAQAQELPPPPRKPPEPLLVLVETGIGLVRLVMPSVKDVRLPTTPAAMPVAPLITLAAKVEPGMLGKETPPPLLPGLPVDTAGLLAVVVTPPPIERR